MKKEKKKVAKIEKKAKVDNKKVLITDEMSDKYMKDKIEKKKTKKGTEVISARIDKDLVDEFDKEAESKNLTRSQLLQQKIEEAGFTISDYTGDSDVNEPKINAEAPLISPITNKEPHVEWIEIRLKNLTDEKLKDVLVFDHHDEFKGRVEYSSSVFDLGIKEFLRQLSAIQKGKYAIRLFRYIASCDLQRFADRQINSYITASFSNLAGIRYTIPYCPDHLNCPDHHKDHNNRVHEGVADVTPTNGVNFYSNLSLSLEYLMPETTLTIYLVVEKIDK